LVAEVVQNLVRWGVEATSSSECKVGSNKKIGEIFGVDLAGDECVVAGGVCVFEDSAIVAGVDPDALEDGSAKRRVGGAEVLEGNVGFGSGENTGEIEDSGGIFRAADSDYGAGREWRLREHVVVRRGRSAGGSKGADVDKCALESAIWAFFNYFVGNWRKDCGDPTGSAPGDDVFGPTTGA
jgi:hypothetical protein